MVPGLSADAHFELIFVSLPIKNAMDCRIIFDLEELFKNNSARSYYIVSGDTDYDCVFELNVNYKDKLKRIPTISDYKRPDEIPA